MSDEQIISWMEVVTTDDEETGSEDGGEDFSSDDDVADPDYVRPEDDLAIHQFPKCTEIFGEGIGMSLNLLNIGEAYLENSSAELQASAEQFPSTTLTSAASSAPSTSRSAAPRFKKRPREVEAQEEEDNPTTSTSGIFTGIAKEVKNDSSEFKSMIWEKKNLQLHVNEMTFLAQKELPAELKHIKTPYDCFCYFVTGEFLQFMGNQMNLYACQTDITTRFVTEEAELRKFIGILIFMSVYRYPNVRSYWGRHSFEAVRQAMTRHQFEEIRRRIHFNDNSAAIPKGQPDYDRLYYIKCDHS